MTWPEGQQKLAGVLVSKTGEPMIWLSQPAPVSLVERTSAGGHGRWMIFFKKPLITMPEVTRTKSKNSSFLLSRQKFHKSLKTKIKAKGYAIEIAIHNQPIGSVVVVSH